MRLRPNRNSERSRMRRRCPALVGEPNEEPLDEYVAERSKPRRWACARFLDGGGAPSAEGHNERGGALFKPGPSDSAEEAGGHKAPEESPLGLRSCQRSPAVQVRLRCSALNTC